MAIQSPLEPDTLVVSAEVMRSGNASLLGSHEKSRKTVNPKPIRGWIETTWMKVSAGALRGTNSSLISRGHAAHNRVFRTSLEDRCLPELVSTALSLLERTLGIHSPMPGLRTEELHQWTQNRS